MKIANFPKNYNNQKIMREQPTIISFKNMNRRDSFELSEYNNLNIKKLKNERDKIRFTEKQSIILEKKLKPYNKNLVNCLLKSQDKNDTELSKLMYIDGGDVVVFHKENQGSPSRLNFLEQNGINGYNVKPRFSYDEIITVLNATNKDNVKFIKPLIKIEDKKNKKLIKLYFEKHKNIGILPQLMQNRKKLQFFEKNTINIPLFNKEVAAFDGYGLAKILKNIDKYNEDYVKKITTTSTNSGHLLFDTNSAILTLKTISKLKKEDKFSKNTDLFLDYLIEQKKMNSDSSRFNGKDISILLNVYKDDIGINYKLKKLIEQPKINEKELKFNEKEELNIDKCLDCYLKKRNQKNFFDIKQIIEEKNKPKEYKYSANEIAKQINELLNK